MRKLIGVVAVAASLVVLIGFPVAFRIYRIPSGGMEPTIQHGERVMSRLSKGPQRGDIIVFDYPLQPSTPFLKRLVGLPGETVEIRDKQLFINGKKAEEPYVQHDDPQTFPRNPDLPEPYRSRDQFGPYTVPPDSYFVLGDNRDRSSDSRYWGVVPRQNVRGVVILAGSWRRGFRRV
ncbi:MAG: signal peptidase I [Acidobacteriota bacterium]